MSKKTIRVSDATFRAIAHAHGFVCDDEIEITDADVAHVWGELQAVPSYVETQASTFATSDLSQLVAEACESLHTYAAPFCLNPTCACHTDEALFEERIVTPLKSGALKIWEAQALLWPER